MWPNRVLLHRVIVVQSYRKAGNGAKGGGRQGCSGKRGTVYQVDPETGKRKVIHSAVGPTFRDMCKALRQGNFIPPYVSIQSKGETSF